MRSIFFFLLLIISCGNLYSAENPPAVTFATSASQGLESVTSGTLPVTLSAPTSLIVTVPYTVTGTATGGGTDYNLANGSLVFSPGQIMKAIPFTVTNDSTAELSETFTVTLGTPSNASLGAISQHTYTIKDNETPTISIVASATSLSEGAAAGSTFTITRLGLTATALSVNITINGAQNGIDMLPISSVQDFANEEISKTVALIPIDDGVSEPDEYVTLALGYGVGYVWGSPYTASTIIKDNDTPNVISISATDSSAREGAIPDTGTFRVTRNAGDISTALTINLISDGKAIKGTDYIALPTTITLPATAAFVDVILTPIDDSSAELDESVSLRVLPGAGYLVTGSDYSTIYILDDEAPVVSVASYGTVIEPSSTGYFTVTRYGNKSSELTINLGWTGSATPGTDFVNPAATLSIPANIVNGSILITPIDDALAEGDETVTLSLNAGIGYSVGNPSSAIIKLSDNEPYVMVSSNLKVAQERSPSFKGRFNFSRNGNLANSLTVPYIVTGTATPGTDYIALSGTVTFAPSVSSTIVEVTGIDDNALEGEETVIVTFASGSGYFIFPGYSSATVVIADNEMPTPTVSLVASDNTATEGGDTATFTVTRSGSTASALTVFYSVMPESGAATSADYAPLSGSVQIPVGATSANVTITALDDQLMEPNETVTLYLSTGAYGNNPISNKITIRDNEPTTIQVTVTDATASEPGTDTGTFTFTRIGDASNAVTVGYAVSGTASPGVDYASLSGSVFIGAGQNSATVTLTPLNDAVTEPDETVVLRVVPGVGYALFSALNDATINLYDDETPVVTVVATDAAAAENTYVDSGRFTLTRTGNRLSALNVNYTVSGSATSASDYTALSGTVAFPANVTSTVVVVNPIDDTVSESNETITLNLQTGTGYIVGTQATATVNLADNDPVVVEVIATDSDAEEIGPNTGSFVVRRIGALTAIIAVPFALTGSASNGVDYTAPPLSYVYLAANVASAKIIVTPISDAIPEWSETVTLNALSGTGYTLGAAASATVTIADLPALTPSAAPTALVATALNGTHIGLTWTDNSFNETGFRIERRTGAGAYATVSTVGPGVSTVINEGLATGTQYFYRVYALNTGGDSLASNEANATTYSIPATPSALVATPINGTQINLTWVDNSNNETGFRIARRTGAESYTTIGTVGAGITSFTNSGLTMGTQYFYRVFAFNPGEDSAASNEANAITYSIPAAPNALAATATSGTQINLSWVDNSNNETGFRIQRRTGAEAYANIATLNTADVTTFEDSGLSMGTQYFYRIMAFNPAGDSTASSEANATTPNLAAPNTLVVTVVSGTQIDLTWIDASNNEAGFRIERRIGAGGFELVASLGVDAITYSNTGLSMGSQYTYRVIAHNAAGNSSPSNEATATTPTLPVAPTTLIATAVNGTQIDLTWIDTANNEAGFRIERRIGAGEYELVTSLGADAIAYSNLDLSSGTQYTYRVIAHNAAGNSTPSNEATATTPTLPAAPTTLVATAVSGTQIDLTWIDASNNEVGFRVERRIGAGEFELVASLGADAITYSNTGLSMGTQNTYRVIAHNAAGNSAPSNEATATTSTLPAAPTTFVATAVSGTQIDLTWVDASNNETGFRIERRIGAGAIELLASPAANAIAYSDTGLAMGTQYTYRVIAQNIAGNSAPSNEATATTPTLPAAPTTLVATVVSGTQIDLTWVDASTNEAGFRVERRIGAGAFELIASPSADATAYSNTGMTMGTQYTYRVIAHNAAGNSTPSNESIATTPTLPAAPTTLVATVVSGSQIDLTWVDASTNEAGFRVERRIGAGEYELVTSVGADAFAYSNTGLSMGTQYTFRVIAHNAAGNSTPSNEATATTPTIPAAPTTLVATVVSGTQIDLSWVDASNNEAGFRIERRIGAGAFQLLDSPSANSTTYSNTGLTMGTQYTYRVIAQNAAGNSTPSNEATATTPTIPAAPTTLVATVVSGTQIDLTWVDASNNESGFKVERRIGEGAFELIASPPADATAYTNTGLMMGTQYTYRVIAQNAAGNSTPSNDATATTPTLPAAPTTLVATVVSGTQIDLTWVDASNNEAGFKVERRIGEGAFELIASPPADATTYSNTGLTLGTQYTYRVIAQNAAGNSPPSNDATATTPTLPAAPTTLVATVVSGTQIDLSWVDASNNEAGFRIERRIGAGAFQLLDSPSANSITYSNTGLTMGTQYTYRLIAHNAAGNSTPSNEATATTPILPAAPTTLVATAVSGTQIDLTWVDASNNEAGFKIERRIGAGAFELIASPPAGATSYSNTGLEMGTQYTYRVIAHNAAGNSSPSDEAHATTYSQPTAPSQLVAVSTFNIDLTWSDNSTNEVGFRIERREGSGTYQLLTSTGADATTFSDPGVSVGVQYTYRVQAFNYAGDSAWSNETMATPRGVILTAPAEGVMLPPSSAVTLSASVNPNLVQPSVQFFWGDTLLNTDAITVAPYNFMWTELAPNVPFSEGTYTVRARVLANGGVDTFSDPVTFSVDSGPIVSISAPISGASTAINVPLSITADANDPDGAITLVEFYNGTNKIGELTSAPYTLQWTPTSLGDQILSARATDNSSNQITSLPVTIRVRDDAITLISPVNNAVLQSGSNSISAHVDSTMNIISVDFSVNGVVIGTDTTLEDNVYSIVWNATDYADYVLDAIAHEEGGGILISPAVKVRINAPLVVTLTTSANGTQFERDQTYILNAIAYDEDSQIQSVEFFVNDISIGTDASVPYEMSWIPTTVGNAKLYACATNGENETNSEIETPNAVIWGNVFTRPIVAIATPEDGQTLPNGADITLEVNISNASSPIVSVKYYDGEQLIGEATAAPFSYSWTNVSGRKSIVAKAQDSLGNIGASPAVVVTFGDSQNNDTTPPIVTASDVTLYLQDQSSVQFQANSVVARDDFDPIPAITFRKVNNDILAPGTAVQAGTQSLTVTATDLAGNTSAPIGITLKVISGFPDVIPPTLPPQNTYGGVPEDARDTIGVYWDFDAQDIKGVTKPSVTRYPRQFDYPTDNFRGWIPATNATSVHLKGTVIGSQPPFKLMVYAEVDGTESLRYSTSVDERNFKIQLPLQNNKHLKNIYVKVQSSKLEGRGIKRDLWVDLKAPLTEVAYYTAFFTADGVMPLPSLPDPWDSIHNYNFDDGIFNSNNEEQAGDAFSLLNKLTVDNNVRYFDILDEPEAQVTIAGATLSQGSGLSQIIVFNQEQPEFPIYRLNPRNLDRDSYHESFPYIGPQNEAWKLSWKSLIPEPEHGIAPTFPPLTFRMVDAAGNFRDVNANIKFDMDEYNRNFLIAGFYYPKFTTFPEPVSGGIKYAEAGIYEHNGTMHRVIAPPFLVDTNNNGEFTDERYEVQQLHGVIANFGQPLHCRIEHPTERLTVPAPDAPGSDPAIQFVTIRHSANVRILRNGGVEIPTAVPENPAIGKYAYEKTWDFYDEDERGDFHSLNGVIYIEALPESRIGANDVLGGLPETDVRRRNEPRFVEIQIGEPKRRIHRLNVHAVHDFGNGYRAGQPLVPVADDVGVNLKSGALVGNWTLLPSGSHIIPDSAVYYDSIDTIGTEINPLLKSIRDLASGSGAALSLPNYHPSNDAFKGELKPHFRHSLEMRLIRGDRFIYFLGGDGTRIKFDPYDSESATQPLGSAPTVAEEYDSTPVIWKAELRKGVRATIRAVKSASTFGTDADRINFLAPEREHYVMIVPSQNKQYLFERETGKIIEIRDAWDNWAKFEYGEYRGTRGRLKSIVDNRGKFMLFSSTETGNLTVTDFRGRSASFGGSGIISPYGDIALTINNDGHVTEFSNVKNAQYTVEVDDDEGEEGQTISVTRVLDEATMDFSFQDGQATVSDYCLQGEERITHTYSYDENFDLWTSHTIEQTVGQESKSTTLTQTRVPGNVRQVASVTNELQGATKYTYGPEIDLISDVTDADERVVARMTYLSSLPNPRFNAAGPNFIQKFTFLSSSQDGKNQKTKYEYSKDGYLASVSDPLGKVSYADWNKFGQPKLILGPRNGYSRTLQYDELGHVLECTESGGGGASTTTIFKTNAAGLVKEATSSDGRKMFHHHDKQGRALGTTGPIEPNQTSGPSDYVRFDERGTVIFTTDSDGLTTSRVVDELGRTTQLTDASGAISEVLSFSSQLMPTRIQLPSLGAGDPRILESKHDYWGRNIYQKAPGTVPVSVTVDSDGRVTETGSMDIETNTEYKDNEKKVIVTDPRGNSAWAEKLASGRTKRIGGDAAIAKNLGFDPNGDLNSTRKGNLGANSVVLNARGQVVRSQIEGTSLVSSYRRDAAGHPFEITQPGQISVSQNADSLGRVHNVQIAGTTVLQRSFTNSNRPTVITSETDSETGLVTAYSDFDAYNRPLRMQRTITRPANSSFSFPPILNISAAQSIDVRMTYRDKGTPSQSETVTLKNAELTGIGVQDLITTTNYDSSGRATGTTDPSGIGESVTYDSTGRVTASTSTRGHTTQYIYDTENGFLKAIRNPDNSGTRFHYDANGNVLVKVDAYFIDTNGTVPDAAYTDTDLNKRPRVTINKYNKKNQLEESLAPGQTTPSTFMYTQAGLVESATHPQGRRVVYKYDPAGRVKTSTVTPGSLVTTHEYYNSGMLKEVVYSDGRAESYTYDSRGRLLTKTVTGQGQLQYTYEHGDLVSIEDSTGQIELFEYDTAHRLVRSVRSGRETLYAYNKAGHLVGVRDPKGQRFHISVNEAGLKTSIGLLDVANGISEKETFAYQGGIPVKDGSVSWSLDSRNRVSACGGFTYGYEHASGLLTDKGSQKILYDSRNFPKEIQDNNARVSYIRRDDGRPTSAIFSRKNGANFDTSMTATWGYDNNHFPTLSEFRGAPNGQEPGPLLLKLLATNTTQGRRETLEVTREGAGIETIGYAYNGLQQLASETRTPQGGVAQTTAYFYDDIGRRMRTEVTPAPVGSSGTDTYEYGERHELDRITHGDGTGTYLKYDENGNTVWKMRAKKRTATLYFKNLNGGPVTVSWNVGQMELGEFELPPLPNGQTEFQTIPLPNVPVSSAVRIVLKEQGPGSASDVIIDKLVIHASSGDATFEAEVPPQGTPDNTTVVIAGTAVHGMDQMGDFVEFRLVGQTSSEIYDYAWNELNRMTQARHLVDDVVENIANFTVAGGWQVTSQTVNGVSTNFSWGYGGELHSETVQGFGTREYSNAGIDHVLWSKDEAAVSPLKFWMTDLNGSVHGLVDPVGNVIERQKFGAYGKTEALDANGLPGSTTVGNRLGYHGRTNLSEVGLQYFRNRYYDPQTSRFLSRDPKGMVDGPNVYGFCGGDPVNATDPMGTKWVRVGSGVYVWVKDPNDPDDPENPWDEQRDADRLLIPRAGVSVPNDISLDRAVRFSAAEHTYAVVAKDVDAYNTWKRIRNFKQEQIINGIMRKIERSRMARTKANLGLSEWLSDVGGSVTSQYNSRGSFIYDGTVFALDVISAGEAGVALGTIEKGASAARQALGGARRELSEAGGRKAEQSFIDDAERAASRGGKAAVEESNIARRLGGREISTLTNREMGEIGENIAKDMLTENGYTNVVSIQNASGNGLDVVARTADGRLAFFEVKTSRVGNLKLSPRQKKGANFFIDDILSQASTGTGRYQGLDERTRRMATEMYDEFLANPLDISGSVIGIDLRESVIRISPWR